MNTVVIDYAFKTDADACYWIDSLYVKYDIPYGYRSHFEQLANNSKTDVDNSKITVIENILKSEGFSFQVNKKEVVK